MKRRNRRGRRRRAKGRCKNLKPALRTPLNSIINKGKEGKCEQGILAKRQRRKVKVDLMKLRHFFYKVKRAKKKKKKDI